MSQKATNKMWGSWSVVSCETATNEEKLSKSNYNIPTISWSTRHYFWALIFSRRLFWFRIELELEYKFIDPQQPGTMCVTITTQSSGKKSDDTSFSIFHYIFHFPHTKSPSLGYLPTSIATFQTARQLWISLRLFFYYFLLFSIFTVYIVMRYRSQFSQ